MYAAPAAPPLDPKGVEEVVRASIAAQLGDQVLELVAQGQEVSVAQSPVVAGCAGGFGQGGPEAGLLGTGIATEGHGGISSRQDRAGERTARRPALGSRALAHGELPDLLPPPARLLDSFAAGGGRGLGTDRAQPPATYLPHLGGGVNRSHHPRRTGILRLPRA